MISHLFIIITITFLKEGDRRNICSSYQVENPKIRVQKFPLYANMRIAVKSDSESRQIKIQGLKILAIHIEMILTTATINICLLAYPSLEIIIVTLLIA